MISLEYLIGAFLGIFFILFIQNREIIKVSKKDFVIKYSQSHILEIIKPLLPPPEKKRVNKNTQAYKHEEKTNVRVIILDDKAFWIKDNLFYSADFTGETIDKDSTSIVDTMGMDKVQLDKMLFIIDQLRDGKDNDNSSSGDN
jgi:hypothetical protein